MNSLPDDQNVELINSRYSLHLFTCTMQCITIRTPYSLCNVGGVVYAADGFKDA